MSSAYLRLLILFIRDVGNCLLIMLNLHIYNLNYNYINVNINLVILPFLYFIIEAYLLRLFIIFSILMAFHTLNNLVVPEQILSSKAFLNYCIMFN